MQQWRFHYFLSFFCSYNQWTNTPLLTLFVSRYYKCCYPCFLLKIPFQILPNSTVRTVCKPILFTLSFVNDLNIVIIFLHLRDLKGQVHSNHDKHNYSLTEHEQIYSIYVLYIHILHDSFFQGPSLSASKLSSVATWLC